MRRIEILAGIMGVLTLTYGQGATAQVRNTVCDTISYEFIEEKIIIPVTVNGVKAKYIVDTGGKTGTLYDAATEMKASAAGYMSVTDVNTQAANFQEAYIKDLTIGSNYRVKQLKTMVFPQNSFFTSLGVVGILGGDAFAESVVTFDSRTQIMVINYPYRPERLKVTDGIPLLTDAEYHSFIHVQLGETQLRVLFDTGADGFLLYSTEDNNRLAAVSGSQVTNRAHGIVAAGISGLGTPVDIKKVTIPSIKIAGKEFANVGSTTTMMNGSIIGVELLKHGKVIIDYMRKRFYFFPFDDGKTDLEGAPSLWNISILPHNGRFEITTVWDSMKDQVTFGDEVVNINGASLQDCPKSQIAVEKIMNDIPGNSGYIIIRRDNKDKRIEIKKEK